MDRGHGTGYPCTGRADPDRSGNAVADRGHAGRSHRQGLSQGRTSRGRPDSGCARRRPALARGSFSRLLPPAVAGAQADDARQIRGLPAIVITGVREDDRIGVEQIADVKLPGPAPPGDSDSETQIRDLAGRLQYASKPVRVGGAQIAPGVAFVGNVELSVTA